MKYRLIDYCIFFSYANHVFYTCFQENSSNKLRVAGSNNYKLELIIELKNQFLQLRCADKLAVTLFGLEKKKASFIFLLIMHISYIIPSVFNSMTREM